MEMKIKDLPLGTRFRLKEGDGKKVWVLLERHKNGLIAEWNGVNCERWPSGYPIQSLCCIQGDEDIIENGSTMEYTVIVNEEDN